MAGNLRKDVELIFRGTDRATPTIKDVRSEVKSLTSAINEQLKSAERGEGSIDDLAKAYKALQAAQGDVGEITRLATAYDALVRKHAEQAQKAEELRREEAQLSAQIAAAEAPTKRLLNARDAMTRRVAAAVQKEQELGTAVRNAGEAFEQAGGDLRNFEASQDAIRTAALETARALQTGAEALDGFKAAQGRGQAVLAAQDDAARFGALAAGSGLPQAQINFISGLENRVEALTLAMRENEASAASMNREIANRAAANAQQRIRDYAGALDEADQAQRRLEAATTFKNQAASIEANAREISRFGAQADTAATSGSRFADAIQQIITPTQTAARTVDGVNDVIGRSESVLEGSKRRLSEYNTEINSLNAALAGLSEMARSIDLFRQQEAAVAGAKAEFDQAQAKVIGFAQAIKTAEQPTEAMARDLVLAETALERAGLAMQRESTKLAQLERNLESAGIDVRNLAAAENQLTASATRAAAAQSQLAAKTGGRGSFLGLNPHEMTNLGFQINDIVVSLASGQRPITVFAQQGAQIGQIIPGAFSAIVRYIPQLAILGGVLITVAGAFASVAREAERTRTAAGIINQMGGDIAATGPQLASFAKSLENAGVKAEDVRKILVSLAADGLNADQMEQYIGVARDLATVTGEELPAAIEKVRSHFQGSIDDIIKLDDETNFLNETELDHIETLYEQGRADEARAYALGIYSDKMQEVAADSKGSWKHAIDNLSIAWQDFLSWIGKTGIIQNTRRELNELAVGARFLAAVLNGTDAKQAANEAVNGLPRAPRRAAADPNRRTNAGRQMAAEQDRELRAAQATTAEQRRALAVEQARIEAIGKRQSDLEITEAQARAGAIFDAQEAKRQDKRDASASKRAEAAARKRQRAAETEARQIENAEEQLQRQLETLDAAVANKQEDSLERRLSAIDFQYNALFRKIDEYSDRTSGRGLVGDKTIAQARDHIRLQQEQLKIYETMEFREKQLQNLLRERSDRLDAIDDKVARGLISPSEGLRESQIIIDDIAGRVTTMAAAAVAFAEGIKGAVPSPQLDAFLAKMQGALQNNTGGQNARAMNERTTDAISNAEGMLNDLISRRTQLVEHENLLVEMGLKGRRESQRDIEGHYQRTAVLIRTQIQNIRALAAEFGTSLTPEMQAYFDSLETRLEAADLQADFLNADFVQLKQGVDQLLTSNIVGFIDMVAQSFADLVSGKGDVLSFFSSIGMAFLDMIAKTLQGIAMLIIQMIVLNAVDKLSGGILKPILKLYGGAGVFHEGGIAGRGNRTRQVSPLVFANAPRYHSGGIAGMAPDETAAILRKGEEVLKETDPRHRNNGGMSPSQEGGMKSIRQLLVIGDGEVAGAMAGPAGEEVVVTHIRRNKATIKQMLDS